VKLNLTIIGKSRKGRFDKAFVYFFTRAANFKDGAAMGVAFTR
jgi:hypothetical protein